MRRRPTVRRRLHRRVQHPGGRRGSRARGRAAGAARARARDRGCRRRRSAGRSGPAGSRHGPAGALRRPCGGAVPGAGQQDRRPVTDSAYIGVSDKYRVATPEGIDVLVRLPSGPSSRRYRAGEPIAAGFHAADARADRGAVSADGRLDHSPAQPVAAEPRPRSGSRSARLPDAAGAAAADAAVRAAAAAGCSR